LLLTDIIWKERIVKKIAAKHDVSVAEMEEALLSGPVFRKMARGRVHGEDVYAALTQIGNGRYLIVFFINKQRGMALPISARNMDYAEKKYYERKK
jgi:uncharacterized DUF497 family protein